MNTLINPETGKSADCQWSRHVLCLAPSECTCPCHMTRGYVETPAELPKAILEADDADIACSVCGELIGDRDDVNYTIEPDGSYTVFHTRQYHIERCEIIGHRFNALGVCEECDR